MTMLALCLRMEQLQPGDYGMSWDHADEVDDRREHDYERSEDDRAEDTRKSDEARYINNSHSRIY